MDIITEDKRSSNTSDVYEAAKQANDTFGSNPAGVNILGGSLGDKILSDYEGKAEAESLAIRDPLTGLFNRRALEQKFDELDKNPESDYSVIELDVDRFKDFNDTYGHPAGDRALKRLAKILETSFRETDLIARPGGEEFVVVFEGTVDVGKKSEEIRKIIEQSHMNQERRSKPGPDGHEITTSIGIATHEKGSKVKSEEIFARADKALYKAKDEGRNRVEVYRE